MAWAFLHCINVKYLHSEKVLFTVLVAAGFLSSAGQTFIQHSQSICDLVTSDVTCNDVVAQLFDEPVLDTFFLLYSSFLSLIASLFSIIVFSCQLLELKQRGRELCSPLIYTLINLSFVVWAIARSYSEWHEVALSFEQSAQDDFVIYQYQSFLITATLLIISQLLILIQINKKRSALTYIALFVAIDFVAFWLISNIHTIAPKFHSVTHLELNVSSTLSSILGPLIYWYFMALVLVFICSTMVNRAEQSN